MTNTRDVTICELSYYFQAGLMSTIPEVIACLVFTDFQKQEGTYFSYIVIFLIENNTAN